MIAKEKLKTRDPTFFIICDFDNENFHLVLGLDLLANISQGVLPANGILGEPVVNRLLKLLFLSKADKEDS